MYIRDIEANMSRILPYSIVLLLFSGTTLGVRIEISKIRASDLSICTKFRLRSDFQCKCWDKNGKVVVKCQCNDQTLSRSFENSRDGVFFPDDIQSRRRNPGNRFYRIALPRIKVTEFELTQCSIVRISRGALDHVSTSMSAIKLNHVSNLILDRKGFALGGRNFSNLALEISGSPNLNIRPNAISDGRLKSISIKSNVIESLDSVALSDISLQSLDILDNTIKFIGNKALNNAKVEENLTFLKNILEREFPSNSFNVQAEGSVKFEDNKFKSIAKDAFKSIRGLKGQSQTLILFNGNEILRNEKNSFSIHPSMTPQSFKVGGTFTNKICHCSLFENEFQESFGDLSVTSNRELFLKFREGFACRFDGEEMFYTDFVFMQVCAEDHDRGSPGGRGRFLETNICIHPGCSCQNETVICDCTGLEHQFQSITVGRRKFRQLKPGKGGNDSYSLVLDAKVLSFSSCENVTIGLSRLIQLSKILIHSVRQLNILPMRFNKHLSTEVGKLEIVISNAHIHDSLEENSFCGPSIKKISFENVTIPHIERMSFYQLTQIDGIFLRNVSVTSEIGFQSFYDVRVREFHMESSWIRRINPNATDVTVGDIFKISDVNFAQISEQAFFQVKPRNPESSVMELVNLKIGSFEHGSLMTRPDMLSVLKNNLIDRKCDCEMYHVANRSTLTHTTSDNHILSSIQCLEAEDEISSWNEFDQVHCKGHEGHDHVIIKSPVLYIGLAVLVVLFLALIVGYAICWKMRRPNVVPILPTGEDEQNWQRVHFENIIKADSQRSTTGSIPMNLLTPPPPYSKKDSSTKQLRRISALTVVDEEDQSIFSEPEAFDACRTLDIVQDIRYSRMSLQNSTFS